MATETTIAPGEVGRSPQQDGTLPPLDISAQYGEETQTAGVVTEAIKAGLGMLGPQVDNAVPAPTQAAPAPTQALPTPNPSEPALPGATVRDDLALDEKAAVQSVDGAVLIKQATDAEMMMFEAAIPRIDGKPGATNNINYFELNIDQMKEAFDGDLAAFQSKIVGANRAAIDHMKRGKMSIEDIINGANKIGLGKMALKMLNQQPGDVANAEELAAAVVTQMSALMTSHSAYVNLQAAPTSENAMTFLMALNLQGALTSALIGLKTETSRSMAVMSHAVKIMQAHQGPTAADVEGLFGKMPEMGSTLTPEEVVANMGGVETIMARGHLYMLLKPDQQSQVSRGFPKWWGKGVDAFMESYMNALLLAPPTQIVNIASNAVFQLMQIPERFIAGMIGSARTSVGIGSKDQVHMAETLAGPMGWMMSFKDSLKASGKAFVTEDPSDLTTKIDYRTRKAITAENFEINPDKYPTAAAAVDYLGKVVRIAGRLLVTSDEFFKGQARGFEKYATAIRRGYAVKSQGGSDAAVNEAITGTVNAPDEALKRTMDDFAKEMTLQTDMDGLFGALQGPFSHPFVKLWLPFYKTPTNAVLQVQKRSPLALAMPSFWRAIKSGGPEADLAMSRLAFSSMIMATMAGWASGQDGDDILITGYGPTDKKARKAWMRQGFQPYSFALKKPDGEYESIPYTRMEPLSGTLAVAADYAWHARHETDMGVLEGLAVGSAFAMWNYASELPMLQGMFEISSVFGSEYEDFAHKRARVTELLVKQIAGAGIKAIPLAPTGSFSASVERYFDPEKRSKIPDDTETSAAVRGFYESLAEARSRNPFFSKDMVQELDRWAVPMTESDGQIAQSILPWKIKQSKYNAVDAELTRLNLGLPDPSRRIKGVTLNADQRREYIKEANNPTGSTEVLLEELLKDIHSQGYDDLDPGEKIAKLKTTDELFWSGARETIIANHPDLARRIAERTELIRKHGKAPIQ